MYAYVHVCVYIYMYVPPMFLETTCAWCVCIGVCVRERVCVVLHYCTLIQSRLVSGA